MHRDLVDGRALAKASIAAGADGIMVEVHNDPQRALSDGKQSIKPEKFFSFNEEYRGNSKDTKPQDIGEDIN